MTKPDPEKYQIIYADPPWRFTGLGSKGIRSAKMRTDKPNLHSNIPIEKKYPLRICRKLLIQLKN